MSERYSPGKIFENFLFSINEARNVDRLRKIVEKNAYIFGKISKSFSYEKKIGLTGDLPKKRFSINSLITMWI